MTKRLRVDEVAGLLPELEELRPVLDLVFSRAVPDPEREWSASGELGTVGDRVLPPDALTGTADELANAIRSHLRDIYEAVERAVGALARNDRRGAARALLDASELEENARRLDRAEAYARAAYRTARDSTDGKLRTECLRRMARTLRSRGRLDDAARGYEEAFDVARASWQDRAAATAAIGRGNVEVDRGHWGDAARWYRTASDLLESVEPSPEHWHVELDLSISARRRGESEESRAHLRLAEERARLMEDPDAAAILENGWGMLLRSEGDPESAAERFRAALLEARDATARVTISVNLGECLLELGQALDAGELAREAERLALSEGVLPKLPEVYRLLGRVAEAQGHRDALVFYERALELIQARGLPEFERAQTLEEYGRAEANAERSDSAREKLSEAVHLYETLGIDEDAERVRSLLDGMEESP